MSHSSHAHFEPDPLRICWNEKCFEKRLIDLRHMFYAQYTFPRVSLWFRGFVFPSAVFSNDSRTVKLNLIILSRVRYSSATVITGFRIW
jgi:hypothetical protein